MSETTKPRAWNSWLAGRSDRKEYWAYIGIVVAISVALSFIPGAPTSAGSTGVILVIQIRRFHDLGRSGWWALALTVAQLVVMLGILFTTPEEIAIGIASIIGLGCVAVMGAIPGQPHENRFGPPRGKRPLKEIFS